jgi:CRP-like cAMP-binding protein
MDNVIAKKIENFFSRHKVREYDKGQILIFGGDEPAGIFYLTKGRVKQYDLSQRGNEVIVNVFKPPAFFPMSWAINQTANNYFFEADTKVKTYLCPVKEAVDFIKANPDVMYDLLSRVYRGTDGLLGRVSQLMAGSAKSRLLFELILETKRFGQQDQRGNYTISMNENELGRLAGLTRETVSREMHALVKTGLIKIERNQIMINNLQLLEKKLENML